MQLEDENDGKTPFMLKPANVRPVTLVEEQLEGLTLADDASGQQGQGKRPRGDSTLAALRGVQPALIEIAEYLGVVYKGELRHVKACYRQLKR